MLKDVLLAKQKEINERLETLLVSDLSAHQKLFDAMNYSLSAVSGYCLCAGMRAYVFPHP